jgi:NAD-dependent SIR2 family protein deacetylase
MLAQETYVLLDNWLADRIVIHCWAGRTRAAHWRRGRCCIAGQETTSHSLHLDGDALACALQWLREADGLLVTAGAGMGVDSGLPDFRGTEGFWRAYPALQAEGVYFADIANPVAFLHDPARAWGFYGHRLNLYRRTVPHRGYRILGQWAERMRHGAFVFTSNVDGHFQKTGFADGRIAKCHGSIHWLQCVDRCGEGTWSADDLGVEIDDANCRLLSPLPRCLICGAAARPNILMFGDWNWIESRSTRQMARLDGWLSSVQKLVVVEVGAGKTIPTVRHFSERHGPRVIRINPRITPFIRIAAAAARSWCGHRRAPRHRHPPSAGTCAGSRPARRKLSPAGSLTALPRVSTIYITGDPGR